MGGGGQKGGGLEFNASGTHGIARRKKCNGMLVGAKEKARSIFKAGILRSRKTGGGEKKGGRAVIDLQGKKRSFLTRGGVGKEEKSGP